MSGGLLAEMAFVQDALLRNGGVPVDSAQRTPPVRKRQKSIWPEANRAVQPPVGCSNIYEMHGLAAELFRIETGVMGYALGRGGLGYLQLDETFTHPLKIPPHKSSSHSPPQSAEVAVSIDYVSDRLC